MSLGVGVLETDVVQPYGFRELAGSLDHRCGDVQPHHTPGHGQPRRVARRLPGPAPDVEDLIVGTNAVRPAQRLIVHPQLGVVVEATELVPGGGGLLRPGLFSLGDTIRVVRGI